MYNKKILQFTGLMVLIFGINLTGFGQLSFTANGTQTIDFSTTIIGVNNGIYNGTGLTPAPAVGQLDSDAFAITGFSDGPLAFGGTATTGDFARGGTTGGVTTGGLYAYTTNPAIYIQPTGTDFVPGNITLRIQNNGATNIQQFTISYNILVRNDQGRANSFNFSFSTDDVNYAPVATLDFTSTEAADVMPAVVTVSRGPVVIGGLTIAPGAFFYLRWSGADISGAGSRDEFGLDNVAVTAQFQPSAAAGTVAGRVINSKGRGLRFVTIMITGNGLPEPLYATTNMFGRYQFEDLPVGETYVMQVFSKRYSFKRSSMVFNLNDNIFDANFIGFER